MYFVYSLIYTLVIIVLLPFEYFKRPSGLRAKWLREKLGLFDSFSRQPLPRIWVHAVSVGEVTAAVPLLKKIREKYPSREIILSTITDTGQKVAREKAPQGTRIIYLPFDLPAILNTTLRKTLPEMLIVIETELWPNMFRVFRDNGIPILLLNGRISEKSFRGYKKISFFMRAVLSCVNFFGMQSEESADRIRSLGVEYNRVENLGNFKFDSNRFSSAPVWAERLKGPVITAGSTHEGEEELITDVYAELKKEFADLNLILAPRHPERFKAVADMMRSKGLNFLKRSDFGDKERDPSFISGNIILLDTVGELSSVYGATNIAVMGKSFRGVGGQNPLEPAGWGKPVVCGPHMENFPVIRDFYKEDAAIEVDEKDLYAQLKRLLLSPSAAKNIGSRAQELCRKNSGAVEKALEIISTYLDRK